MRARASSLKAVTLFALLLTARQAQAQDGVIRKRSRELGFVAGVGIAHPIFGGRADREFVLGGLRLGYVLTGAVGPGPLRSNFEVAAEVLPGFVLFQEQTTPGLAATLMFRHILRPGARVVPTINYGAGFVYTKYETPGGTTRLNFTPQIGAGLLFFPHGHTSFGIEYRLHHISNGGRVEPNPGINSSFIQFTVAFFRHPI